MLSLGSVIQKHVFFLSLLCWWHTALPLIPTRGSDSSCFHLSLPDRHFLLDERQPPSTKPCRPSQPNTPTKLLLSASFVNHNSVQDSQKPWSCDCGSQLNFTDHIARTAQFRRFATYNIKRIKPFLSVQATELLVQALVLTRLDYMLSWQAFQNVMSNLCNWCATMPLCDLRLEALIHPSGHGQVPQGPHISSYHRGKSHSDGEKSELHGHWCSSKHGGLCWNVKKSAIYTTYPMVSTWWWRKPLIQSLS